MVVKRALSATTRPLQHTAWLTRSYFPCGCPLPLADLLSIALFTIYSRSLNVPNKIAVNLAGAMAAMMALFLVASNGSFGRPADIHSAASCKAVAIAMHYTLYVVFMWFGVEGFHLYRCFVTVFKVTTVVRPYALFAWLVPVAVVVPMAVIWEGRYGDPTAEICWIDTAGAPGVQLALLSPLLLVTAFGLYVWFKVISVIYASRKDSDARRGTASADSHALRNAAWAGFPFFLTMGPTWGLTFFISFGSNVVFHYVFGFLNAFSGVWYIVLRVARDPVLRQQAGFMTSRRSATSQSGRSGNSNDVTPSNTAQTISRASEPKKKTKKKKKQKRGGVVVRRRDRTQSPAAFGRSIEAFTGSGLDSADGARSQATFGSGSGSFEAFAGSDSDGVGAVVVQSRVQRQDRSQPLRQESQQQDLLLQLQSLDQRPIAAEHGEALYTVSVDDPQLVALFRRPASPQLCNVWDELDDYYDVDRNLVRGGGGGSGWSRREPPSEIPNLVDVSMV